MPEKRSLFSRHSRGKGNRASGANVAFAMAYLRGRYNDVHIYKNSNRRNDVRHYRLVRRDLLDAKD